MRGPKPKWRVNFLNKAERELLKRLGLAPDVLDAVREQLDQAVLQPANAGAALQPLPLCNNHLRPDEPRDSQAQNDTDAVHASVHSGESVRQKPPPSPAEIRKSRIIAMGMDMSQISSVVRTETVSPLDIFRRRRQLAEESGLFSVLFGEDTAKRANFGNAVSTCLGVPFGVSESIYVRGCKSPAAEAAPPADADTVRNLLDYGAMPLGYIRSLPYNLEPDNAAHAVACGAVPFSLGVGSSLIESAACGVTSLRTTYGLCSRFGVLCRAPSMEIVQLHASCVRDLTMALRPIFTGSRRDCTSFAQELPDWYGALSAVDIRTYTIGIADCADTAGPAVSAAVNKAAELFELLGATVVRRAMPTSGCEAALASIIAAAECKIEDTAGRRSGKTDFSDLPLDARREILRHHLLLENERLLTDARRLRSSTIQGFERALCDVNAVIAPAVTDAGTPTDIQFIPALAGLCALSLPCGVTPEGKNIALLIIGRMFSESTLLSLGNIYEQATKMTKEMVRRGRRCRLPDKA